MPPALCYLSTRGITVRTQIFRSQRPPKRFPNTVCDLDCSSVVSSRKFGWTKRNACQTDFIFVPQLTLLELRDKLEPAPLGLVEKSLFILGEKTDCGIKMGSPDVYTDWCCIGGPARP